MYNLKRIQPIVKKISEHHNVQLSVIGSVKEKGKSYHDVDVLLKEDCDFEKMYEVYDDLKVEIDKSQHRSTKQLRKGKVQLDLMYPGSAEYGKRKKGSMDVLYTTKEGYVDVMPFAKKRDSKKRKGSSFGSVLHRR